MYAIDLLDLAQKTLSGPADRTDPTEKLKILEISKLIHIRPWTEQVCVWQRQIMPILRRQTCVEYELYYAGRTLAKDHFVSKREFNTAYTCNRRFLSVKQLTLSVKVLRR